MVTALIVLGVRWTAGAQFAPARAATPPTTTIEGDLVSESAPLETTIRTHGRAVTGQSLPATAPEPPVGERASTPEPTSQTIASTPAVGTPAAAPSGPTPTIAPATPTQAAACPAGGWLCYPRLGVSGAIVPYTDCSGATDVGSAIRSFNCLSDHYLMGHAYTQFGRIVGWQVGDVVIAYGRTYTVFGAFTQSACAQPRLPLAPLELQTSLTASPCGEVLVVQAR